MTGKHLMKVAGMVLLVGLLTSICISSFAAGSEFKVWWYERDNAMDASWKAVLAEFSKKHPDVKVKFEQKAFEQVQETAKMVLNSNDCPDLLEINKGNSTCGMYAKDGLLSELDQVATEKGWDKILSPSIQTTCRYNSSGIMGSGKLYGVTTYGEFVMVYYNKDIFTKYKLKVPATLAEFEKICDTFVKNKITPIVIGGADKWPQTQNWYELALYKANRKFISDFELLQDDINFKGPEFKFASDKFVSYVKNGYFEKNSNGIKYDDANSAFYQGKYPMILTGSWLFGAVKNNVKTFKWGVFILPGKKLNTGSGGNLWAVPKNARNKELAYEFINLTLQKKAQTMMAEKGGLPLNADLAKISDPSIKELNALFAGIVKNDGLAFYPDWPVPGFMDALGGGLQSLFSGNMTGDQFLDSISTYYYDYKNSMK
jgi:raffinose/stachyose/melibiose transport system substrate-binding protein